MTRSVPLKTHVTPELKAAFIAQMKALGRKPSDALRSLVQRAVKDDVPTEAPFPAERRWKVVNTRVSASEWKKLQPILSEDGSTVSNLLQRLLRARLLKAPQMTSAERQALEQATRELRAIGLNLNQLVRAANQGKVDANRFTDRYAGEISDRVDAVRDSIQGLVRAATDRDL